MTLLMLPRGLADASSRPGSSSSSVLKDLRVYSQQPAGRDGGVSTGSTSSWAGSEMSRALPDGTLEVSGPEGSLQRVRPMEEATLISLPGWTLEAFSRHSTQSLGGTTLESMTPRSNMA